MVVLALANGSATAQAGTPAQWSKPARVDGVRLLTAVSCVSRRFCVAVGGRQAVAYRSGSWSRPQTIDSHGGINRGLATVSCVSARFCAAVDGVGEAFVYNGRRWSAWKGPAVAALACASRTFCVALDANGSARFYRGFRWSAPRRVPSGGDPVVLSCPLGGFCMVLDTMTNQAYRLARGHWVRAGTIPASFPPGGSEPNVASAVSCSGRDFCAALDDFGEAFTWTGGRHWSRPHAFDANLLTGTDAVSCASRKACMAVDENGLATSWDGSTWSPVQRIDSSGAFLNDVSCAAAGFCIAVDLHARALIYR